MLAWPEKTEHDGWTRRVDSGEIAGETVLAQSFHVIGPNLRAIRFYARPYGSQVAGTVHLRLVEIRGDDARLMNEMNERDVSAAEVVSRRQYEYHFTPIPFSTDRYYLFTIALPDAPAGRGIIVEIMRQAYGNNPANAFSFAGRHRFGSLRFTAEADRTTLLGRTVAYLQKGPFGSARIVAVAMAWVALHLLGARAVVAAGALRA